jgi:formylmethanofuran dehydrogenase subunit E
LYPGIADKNQQQMKAYREMDDAELFGEQWVEVAVGANEMPGYKGARIACAACGEGINYERFVERDGETLCLACAHPEQRYYRPAGEPKLREENAAHRRSECA